MAYLNDEGLSFNSLRINLNNSPAPTAKNLEKKILFFKRNGISKDFKKIFLMKYLFDFFFFNDFNYNSTSIICLISILVYLSDFNNPFYFSKRVGKVSKNLKCLNLEQ